jgi:hypothetical protein
MLNNLLFHTIASPSFTKSLEVNLITVHGSGKNTKRTTTDNIDLTALDSENLKLISVIIENTANKEIEKLNYINRSLEDSRKLFKAMATSQKNEIYLTYLQRSKTKEKIILLLEECLDYCLNKKEQFEEYVEEV